MAKLYKAVDKMDGKMSAFLVLDDGCVITSWFLTKRQEISAGKSRANEPASSTHDDFNRRALNPVLIAEW